MKTIQHISTTLIVLLLWTAFVGYGFVDGFLLRPITSDTSPEAFVKATKEAVDAEFVGNFALVLIENGEIAADFFYSIGKLVDENSVFPVASISKWITSFGILKLVEQGAIDLDAPVDDYLTRWHLPESEFDNRKVTVRRLLSHSSGLVDDLGYAGFAANEPIQTIEESLTKAADSPYAEGVARVGFEPGSEYMYSGAGYTLLQLVIEEVTGQSFQEYISQVVFDPLEMTHSAFNISERPDLQLVEIYKDDGTTRVMNRFTALAAAALCTSPSDLSKFMIAHVSRNPVLSMETIDSMSVPQTFINDIGVYGLGPHLYSQNEPSSTIIGHDGSGNNAINSAARIDLTSKDGIIVLTTGNYDIASSMADEWIFWKAGIADYVVMQRNISYLLTLLGMGFVFILIASAHLYRGLKSRTA